MHEAIAIARARALNPIQFAVQVAAELARIRRHGGTLGLIHFSLDPLTVTQASAQQIDHLAAYLARRIRAHDHLARTAHHEFAVLAPALDLSETTGLAVKLRHLVHEYRSGMTPLSASLGVVEWQRGESAEQLTQRARHAMESARAAGGNRVSASAAG